MPTIPTTMRAAAIDESRYKPGEEPNEAEKLNKQLLREVNLSKSKARLLAHTHTCAGARHRPLTIERKAG